MPRISKKKRKAEKRNKIIISIIFTLFMVTSLGSVVIYYGNDDPNSFTVKSEGNSFDFTLNQDAAGSYYYTVKGDKETFTVYFPPEDVSYLNYTEEAFTLLKNSVYFYMAFDPRSEDLSLIDFLRFDLRQNIPQRVSFQDAVVTQDNTYALPVISCLNATESIPVITLIEAKTTSIATINNCVNVAFAQQDVLRVRDLLLYFIQGINPGEQSG